MAAGDALTVFYDHLVTLIYGSARTDIAAVTNELITFCTRPQYGDDFDYPRVEVLPAEGEILLDMGAKQVLTMRAVVLVLEDVPADSLETHTDSTLAIANDIYAELMLHRVVANKWFMLKCDLPNAQDARGTEWIENPDGFCWTIIDVEARCAITPT